MVPTADVMNSAEVADFIVALADHNQKMELGGVRRKEKKKISLETSRT